MPIVDINGTEVDFPDNLSGDALNKAVASAAEQMGGGGAVTPKSIIPKSMDGFLVNADKDLKENITAPAYAATALARASAPVLPFGFPPAAALHGVSDGNVYSPENIRSTADSLVNTAKTAVKAVPEVARQLYQSARHPVESFYRRPFSTVFDIATVAGLGAGGANAMRSVVRGAARKTLPGIFKSTAGIPERATEIVIDKPSVLKRQPVPEEMLSEVVGKPVIDAIQRAKRSIGDRFGKIFRRYAGMEGPMQEIINTPIGQKLKAVKGDVQIASKLKLVEDNATGTGMVSKKLVAGDPVMESRIVGYKPGERVTIPRKTHSYEDIIINKNLVREAFVKGDQDALKHLYKEYVGTPKSDLNALTITPKDKLQIMTRLKREIQRETDFNKAPVTLKPIDGAKDAALKVMAGEIDDLRTNSKLPGAIHLAKADEAWSEINGIFDTIQRDLSDPGKSRDTMMRLLKGDNTWLTSGRMEGKVKKIRAVELITGQKILDPAMEELTRQVFKDWSGKGFVSQFLRGTGLGATATALVTGNPVPAIALAGSTAATSPRVLRKALKASSRLGAAAKLAATKTAAPSAAGLSRAFISRDAEERR